MRNHYIPRLLLRQFAGADNKINIYRFGAGAFATCKLKNAFAEKDIFSAELEFAFNTRLEGPFADLLNHRLLTEDTITIDRKENFLIRKFLMINSLRNPMTDTTFDEKVALTQSEDHPVVLKWRKFMSLHPEWAETAEKMLPSQETYISNLERAIEIRDISELTDIANDLERNASLAIPARLAMAPMIAFWDCGNTGQEFVLPKLQGISIMDNMESVNNTSGSNTNESNMNGSNAQGLISLPYKVWVVQRTIEGIRNDMNNRRYPEYMSPWVLELCGMLQGSLAFCDNFSIYPISPTRALVYISPYFRGYFPIMDRTGRSPLCPPIFTREQFDRHFWKPMRMELFRPCGNACNQTYTYQVRRLTSEEVCEINSVILNMETQEFAFHDYNKIRDSLRYYDETAQFALPKKHDFRRWG